MAIETCWPSERLQLACNPATGTLGLKISIGLPCEARTLLISENPRSSPETCAIAPDAHKTHAALASPATPCFKLLICYLPVLARQLSMATDR